MTRFVLLLCGLLALAVGVSTATAGDHPHGNSDNAKLCQKNGWMDLAREDQTAFANQGECVSYAAKGGVLVPKSRAHLLCESYGGTFGSTDLSGGSNPPAGVIEVLLWSCNGYTDDEPDEVFSSRTLTFVNPCFVDSGGNVFNHGPAGSIRNSTCFRWVVA